jgi:ATP-dependent Clp protease ATP-binding subunit ClpC
MFEKFTDRARQVVVLAQEEARLLAHNYIGTEHVLLALLDAEDGTGVLAGLGLDRQRAEAQIGEMLAAAVEQAKGGGGQG